MSCFHFIKLHSLSFSTFFSLFFFFGSIHTRPLCFTQKTTQSNRWLHNFPDYIVVVTVFCARWRNVSIVNQRERRRENKNGAHWTHYFAFCIRQCELAWFMVFTLISSRKLKFIFTLFYPFDVWNLRRIKQNPMIPYVYQIFFFVSLVVLKS